MSDYERLKSMVEKLRTKEWAKGEARSLAGSTPSDRMAALLTEAGETILPRRLIFAWDDGPGLQIAVANRRIQGVLPPCHDLLKPFAGKALADPDSDLVDRLRDALQGVFETAGPIAIRSVPLGADDLGSDAGLAADALRQAWGITEPGTSKVSVSEALPAFLKALDGSASAWLSVRDEEVTDQQGAAADLAALGDTAAYVLDAYLNRRDAVFKSSDGVRAFAISGAGTGLFFGDTGEEAVFVWAEAAQLAGIVMNWRRSFG